MKRTVLSMLDNAVSQYGDNPYLHDKSDEGWAAKSFSRVKKEAGEFALFLLLRGVGPGERVAILAEGSGNWAIGEFGILHAGCISVPLSIQLLPREIPFRFNHAGVSVVLTNVNNIRKICEIRDQIESFPMVVMLDGSEDDLAGIASESGFTRGKDFFHFDDALREARERRGERENELKARTDAVGEDDVVTISYTSGTTGDPKGIMLTHLNYWANCADSIKLFNVPRDFRTILILPCDHSFAHTVGLYAPLLRGIRLFFVDSRGGRMAMIRNISPNINDSRPHFLLTVPAVSGNFMKKIRSGIKAKGAFAAWLFDTGMRCGIAFHGNGFNRVPFLKRAVNVLPYKIADRLVFRKVKAMFGGELQFCVGGGALLDVRQQEFFYTLGIPIFQGYGLTEAAPVISSNTPEIHKLGSSGMIAPTVTCRIVRADGTDAAVGEKGQIVIRGNNVMKGYYRNDEATASTVKEGWLYTGDLGYYDKDGFLIVVGREKSLLIAEDGEKYSPEEIEEAIMNTSPYINQAMVYNNQCRYTTAVVTLDNAAVGEFISSASPSAEELLEEIRRSFYSFQEESAYRDQFPVRWIPSCFQILPEAFTMDNGMMNSTMKIVRFKVMETYRDYIDYMYTSEGSKINNPRNLAALETLSG